MSRAESHEVGGGKAVKNEGGEGGGGLEDRDLNERGAGDGVGDCLSLRRTAMIQSLAREKAGKRQDNKSQTLIDYIIPAPSPN